MEKVSEQPLSGPDAYTLRVQLKKSQETVSGLQESKERLYAELKKIREEEGVRELVISKRILSVGLIVMFGIAMFFAYRAWTEVGRSKEGYEYYSTATNDLALAKSVTANVSERLATVSQELAEVKKENEDLKGKPTTDQHKLRAAEAKVLDLEDRMSNKDLKLSETEGELEDAQAQIEQLTNEVAMVQQEIKVAKQEIGRLNDNLYHYKGEVETLQEKLYKSEEMRDELARSLKVADEKLKVDQPEPEMEREIASLRDVVSQLEVDLEKTREENQKLMTERLLADGKEFQKTPLHSDVREIEHLREKIGRLEKDLEATQEQLTIVRKSSTGDHQRARTLQDEVSRLGELNRVMEENLRVVRAALITRGNEKEVLRRENQRLQQAVNMEEKERSVATRSVEQLQAEVSNLRQDLRAARQAVTNDKKLARLYPTEHDRYGQIFVPQYYHGHKVVTYDGDENQDPVFWNFRPAVKDKLEDGYRWEFVDLAGTPHGSGKTPGGDPVTHIWALVEYVEELPVLRTAPIE